MYWFLIIGLLVLGWRLGQPELSNGLRALRRRRQWLGSLKPDVLGVQLYQDARDLHHMSSYISEDQVLHPHLKKITHQCAQLLKKPSPLIDVRLCIAARWIGEAVTRGQEIPQGQVVRFVSHHFGICSPIPWVVQMKSLKDDSPTWIVDRFYQNIYEAIAHKAPRLSIGISQLSLNKYEQITVLLMQPQYCTFKPFTRHLSGDMGMIVQGELLDYLPIELWITPPNGISKKLSVQQEGVNFSFQLNDRERGVYQIELLGESHQGPVVCMNVPIYRSIKPPVELALTSPSSVSRMMWLNRLRLRQLIHESRQRAGIKRLKNNRSLTAVAQRYANEMAEYQFVAHTSPRGERLHHRTEEIPLISEKTLENLSVGFDVDELHDRLMNSPAHRAAILDDEVTHLGVGVSQKNGLLYAVELFNILHRKLRLTEDRTDAYRLIQEHRKLNGLGRLPHAQELEEVSLKVARALVVGQCLPHESEHHSGHLLSENYDLHFPIETLLFQVDHVSRIPLEDTWLLDQVKSFGVGLAQGKRSEPIWVVVLLRLTDRNQNKKLLEHSS